MSCNRACKFLAYFILPFTLSLFMPSQAVKAQGESPVITSAFANSPRWATLEWRHSGTGVYWFVIEHESTVLAVPDSAKRIWTITELQADTVYRFRVCAVFAFNRQCSNYASVRTQAFPPPPAPPSPPPVNPPPPPPPPFSSSLLPKDILSFQAINFPGRFIRHRNFLGEVTPILNQQDRNDATFAVRPALDGNADARSLEAVNLPGYFLRHKDFKIRLDKNDGTQLFKWDASFKGLKLAPERPFEATTLEPVNFPFYYIRHKNFQLVLEKIEQSHQYWQDARWMPIPVLTPHAPAGAFSFEAGNAPGRFLRHRQSLGYITPITTALDKSDANFIVRRGLNGNEIGISLESVNYPGSFLRHENFRIKLGRNDNSQLFKDDATFLPGLCEPNTYCRINLEAANKPAHYIRHRNFELWLSPNDAQMGGDHSWQIQPPR